MAPDAQVPLRVYGSKVSYFTGKLEAYLRYKGIAYQRIALSPDGQAVFTGQEDWYRRCSVYWPPSPCSETPRERRIHG